MQLREIEALERQVIGELQAGLAARSLVDEQLRSLRKQREEGEQQIATARAMIRFLEAARQTAVAGESPQTPARESAAPTATAALSASEPQPAQAPLSPAE